MKMKFCFIAASLMSLLLCHFPASAAPAKGDILKEAVRLERKGQFTDASSLLRNFLKENKGRLSAKENKAILFQIVRMRRIRIDYSLTADQLYGQLENGISGVTRAEFRKWIREKKFDDRFLDDTLRFVNASRSNLFFRYPDIAARRIPPVHEKQRYLGILANCLEIERTADSLRTPYVLPKSFNMKMVVTVDSGTVKPGDLIKAWLPIPHKFPYQIDFKLVSSSTKPIDIASPESPIRSVFMEQPANSDGGAKFSIEYTYETFGVHFNLEASHATQYDKSDNVYKKFTSEGPNIIFTSRISSLSKKIIGKVNNPVVKAKLIYDWIAHNIEYSFAREYSTLNNISNYCLTHRYGDCGQEAMLFITLCRYNGIPARWQSGWFFIPGGKDIHDWTQIYIEPYGWVPVDPYMGILSTQYMTSLTEAQRKIVRDFYFGGLDQYRMSANSNNNQKLSPAKRFFRSDNVDFQRAELETDTHNIYFNHFDYSLNVKEEDGK